MGALSSQSPQSGEGGKSTVSYMSVSVRAIIDATRAWGWGGVRSGRGSSPDSDQRLRKAS